MESQKMEGANAYILLWEHPNFPVSHNGDAIGMSRAKLHIRL